MHPASASQSSPRDPLPGAAWLLLAALAVVAGFAGCATEGASQLGQINTQLGNITTQVTTELKNQTSVIEAQKQLIANIQVAQQTVQTQTTKVDTVLQKEVTGVVDLLNAMPTQGLVPKAASALAGAKAYANAAQTESGGVYTGSDRVNAAEIATGEISLPTVQTNVGIDLATYTKAHEDLVTAQTNLTSLQQNLNASNTTLANTNRQLDGATGELNQLRSKMTLDKIWDELQGPVGIVCIIALLIAFPALLPVIGWAIGRIVSTFPALLSFFGVASQKTISNVATGVGNFKDELDKLGPEAQVKVTDIKAMLGKELTDATDELDRRVIDHIRSTKNVS